MNVKKEITISIIISLITFILIGFYIFQYSQQQNKSTSTITPNQTTNILTISEIAKHNNTGDCWFIIGNNIYNVTDYLNQHPGGNEIMIPYCGQDATQAFLTKDGRGSHSGRAYQELLLYKIGPLVK